MTKAIIFDLDGTLIQTEVLKASSYAKAVNELTQQTISEEAVLAIFQNLVGLSRVEVLQGLYDEFSEALKKQLNTTDSILIKETLINKRLEIYRNILSLDEILKSHFCSKTLGLFNRLYDEGYKLVLATMSHNTEALKVLETMNIREKFDFILTRDDVKYGKPNPEIYLKAIELLNIPKEECLIIEDSVNGIKAAINAGVPVFAITNSITNKSVNEAQLLSQDYVINDTSNFDENIYNHIGLDTKNR